MQDILFSEHQKTLGDKFSEEVPLMGVSEAIRSTNRFAKVFWALIFMTCLAATLYFTYNVFDEYAKNPTATKVGDS